MSMNKGEKEIALRKLAQDLGCSLYSTYEGDKHYEDEVVRRIQEAGRSIREARMWWIAVGSAIAAIISALAAWTAVILSSCMAR